MKLYNVLYKVMGIQFGKGLRLQGFPILFSKSRAGVTLGDDVTIKSSFLSNLIGLYQRTVMVARTPEAKIIVGNDVGMSGVTIYARDSIRIGSHTRIGANTKIMDNDFHPVDPQLRMTCSNKNMGVSSIEIGENVFIGCNCLILKGAKIGSNTTIGAGSVVTGNIPENCVAAGNPAKVIKKLGGGKIVFPHTAVVGFCIRNRQGFGSKMKNS